MHIHSVSIRIINQVTSSEARMSTFYLYVGIVSDTALSFVDFLSPQDGPATSHSFTSLWSPD